MCPCFKIGEERAARTSLQVLWNLPVVWFRDHDSTSPSAVTGLVRKFFYSTTTTKKNGIPSILCWMDGDNGPVIQVQPQTDSSQAQEHDSTLPLQQSVGYMKTLC